MGLPGGDAELWFDFEPRHTGLLTSRADPWPLAVVFTAMHEASTLVVDGEVSRELLTNLETFQEVWRVWGRGRYRPVSLAATSEVGGSARAAGHLGPALLAFGGGLDGCYTAWKHARGTAGRRTLSLVAGLMVLGLQTSDGVDPATVVEDARALRADLGIDLWIMRTNVGRFVPEWNHAYGAVLASCLHWFSGGVTVGVLAGAGTLTNLNDRCGSHPLTDPLLGSDRLRIVHDGAERDFAGKAELVAAWPEAVRRLRAGSGPTRVLASLALAVVDGQLAEPLTGEATADAVRSLALESTRDVRDAQAVLKAAESRGLQGAAWYEALSQRLVRSTAAAAPQPSPERPRPGLPPHPVWGRRVSAASEIRVVPEPPVSMGDRVVLAARIHGLGDDPKRLWFSVEARHARHLSPLADPFACALQMPAMRGGAALVIEGPVSRVLLRNLEQFQEVWHAWAPREVTPVSIRADEEVDGAPASDDALMFFSGGVDSSFSVYRHHRGLLGRRTRRIAAGLMVLGFDIPSSEARAFRGAFENSRRMLESIDIDLWSMATNFRDVVCAGWEPGHGTAIAACAHCFAGHFGTALVAATGTINFLDSPWGTHVLTDRLLSSDRLGVVTDGVEARRVDKVLLLAEWSAAMRRLRVCFLNERRDRNCGECSKCTLTALSFLANGLPLPSTLRRPSPRRMRRMPLSAEWEIRAINTLHDRARAIGVADQRWWAALEECVRWNEDRWTHPVADDEPPSRRFWDRVRRRLGRVLRGPT